MESRYFETCNSESITSLYGELSYRRPLDDRAGNEECEWNFLFRDYKQDYALIMDFAFVNKGSHENNSLQLPNGKHYSYNLIR